LTFLYALSLLLLIPPYHTPSSHFIVFFHGRKGRQGIERSTQSDIPGLGRVRPDWTGLDWTGLDLGGLFCVLVFLSSQLPPPLYRFPFNHTSNLRPLFHGAATKDAMAARIYEIPFGGEVALIAKQFPGWLFWGCWLVWVRFIVIISVVTTRVLYVCDCFDFGAATSTWHNRHASRRTGSPLRPAPGLFVCSSGHDAARHWG
jgi:hypothetical protein